MQNLYYYSASVLESSSLIIVNEDGSQSSITGISNLIVCGSQQQILVYSGSYNFASFSTDGSNLYKVNNPNDTSWIQTITSSADAYTQLDWNFDIADVISNRLSDTGWRILTGSTILLEGTASFAAGGKPVTTSSFYTVETYSTTLGPFTSYINVFDTTQGPPDITNLVTQSVAYDKTATATFYASASHNYRVYMYVTGTSPNQPLT